MAISTTTGLPALVSILQLGSGTLTSAAVVPASMTVAGVATTLGFPVSAFMTTGFGALPTGGATGQLLNKTDGGNFDTQWSNITQFVGVGPGLGTSGSATSIVVALASVAGLSVLGVVGTTQAVPAPITASASGQVLSVNAGGTGLLWTTVSGGQAPFNTTSLAQFGALYGNGTGVIGATPAGTTGFLLTGNGSASAPSFQPFNLGSSLGTGVVGVPNGGTNATTLAANGVLYGNGTSTVGVTAVGTSGYQLMGGGAGAAPSFQLPIDVFMAYGDSNCVGQGSTTGSPIVPPGWVEQYAANGTISDANDPTLSAISTTQNAATGSLWPAFGIAYGRRVGLVLCGKSGTVQAPASDTGAGNWDPTGTLLAPALAAASAAMSAFKAANYAPTFKGFVYILGNNDALAIDNGTSTQAQYSTSFASTIASCRAASIAGVTYPDATFYVPIIGTNLSTSDVGYAQVRGAQQAIAAADGNIVVPWSEMYSFLNRGLLSSGVHPTQAGYNIFGAMVGKGILPHIPDNRPYAMLNANTAIGQVQATGTVQHLIGANGLNAILNIDAFGGGAIVQLRRADGTALGATSVVSGDLIGAVAAVGLASTTFPAPNNAFVGFTATETHSTGQGTKVVVAVTPNGSSTNVQRFVVNQDGSLTASAYATGIVTADGGGNYTSTPSGGVIGHTLLTSIAVNAQTFVQDTSFTSTFNDYYFVMDNIVPTNLTTLFQMLWQSGGVFQTTSYVNGAGGATTYVDLTGGTNVSTTAGQGFSSPYWLMNVNNATAMKLFRGLGVCINNAGAIVSLNPIAYWNNTGTLTGWKLQVNTGTFSGNIHLYGLRNA